MYKATLLSQQREFACLCSNPKVLSNAMSHTFSLVTVAIALYLDSTEDQDTTYCFLHFQEIKESPKKIQKPKMDLLVSGQAAQSASQYALSFNSESAERNKP